MKTFKIWRELTVTVLTSQEVECADEAALARFLDGELALTLSQEPREKGSVEEEVIPGWGKVRSRLREPKIEVENDSLEAIEQLSEDSGVPIAEWNERGTGREHGGCSWMKLAQ